MVRHLEPELVALPYQLARGALVALPDPAAKDTTKFDILRFQFNPETVTRARTGQWERKLEKKTSKAAQEKAASDAQRGGALKSKSEVISFKLIFDCAELRMRDAADADGVLPELAILERFALGPDQMPEPAKKDNEFPLIALNPTEALLVLGPRRFPGVITQMSIVEQRFDLGLVPIRAEIDVRFRVLEDKAISTNKATKDFFEALMNQRTAMAEKAKSSYEGSVEQALAKALAPGRIRRPVDGEIL